MTHNHHRADYRSPELPIDWYGQDWLLILETPDHYVREHRLTKDQELRAYHVLEAIARLRGVINSGSVSIGSPFCLCSVCKSVNNQEG